MTEPRLAFDWSAIDHIKRNDPSLAPVQTEKVVCTGGELQASNPFGPTSRRLQGKVGADCPSRYRLLSQCYGYITVVMAQLSDEERTPFFAQTRCRFCPPIPNQPKITSLLTQETHKLHYRDTPERFFANGYRIHNSLTIENHSLEKSHTTMNKYRGPIFHMQVGC